MTEINDDEESFLVPAETENSEQDKVWCKIGERGDLEYVDWGMVEGMARMFDATPPEKRTETMLISKLMWLVREQTRKEMARAGG